MEINANLIPTLAFAVNNLMRLKETRDQLSAIRAQTVACVGTFGSILLFTFGWPLQGSVSVLAQETTAITHTTGSGDLGTRTISQGQTIHIIGGTRSDQGSGRNLFHSFDQFSVGDGYTAKFLNTTRLPTDNILSRVTGGDLSSIFGTIDTTSYPGANFFLMNPAGIVFGPTAALHVDGAVAFTTADYLRLANANGSNTGIFRADPRATPQLSSAPIAAFGFLGDNSAAIKVTGAELPLDPGQSFSFVGGNVTIQSATLADKADSSAPGNHVYIGSLASRGEILVGTLASAANINGELPRTLGTVHISQGSTIDTSNRAGGTIRISGGQLIVDGSNIYGGSGGILLDGASISIKNSARIGTYTITTANAGNVVFEATNDIDLDSNTLVESQTFSASRDAGNITFKSTQGNITFSHGSNLTTQSFEGGRNTGSIEIDAQDGDIVLDSSNIFTSTTEGTGTTGGIKINANNLDLRHESRIDSDNNNTQVANPTDILVRNLLTLTGKSEIETTAIGEAPAADISLKATEIRILEGSKLSADTESLSSGSGGRVSIRGPLGSSNLILTDGSGSGIFTDTKGTGPGGTIDLSTQSLMLQNGGAISSSTTGTSTTATGGSIIINATDQVTLTNGALITAHSSGQANAGIIDVNAGQQLIVRDSSVMTEAKQASGGDITLRAIDRIQFTDSALSTSVLESDGSGGNIFIDPNVVTLQNSFILSQAVLGNGGNVTIVAPLFLMDSASRIDVSSKAGLDGKVTARSNLISTIPQLESKATAPQVLLQNRCVALAGGEQSTFILAGRDARPSEPGGWLSSPIAMEHWTGEGTADHASGLLVQRKSSSRVQVMAALRNDTAVLSLRRLTPPGFLVRTFATGTTGCPS